jgi:predicted ester cyclase
MSEQENVGVVEQWLAALNAHDFQKLDELRGPGYLVEHPSLSGPVSGEEEDVHLRRLTEAFPDWHWEDTQMIAQGDYVAVNGVRKGTQTGPIGGHYDEILHPTGRTLSLRISVVLKIEGGKIVHSSVYYDRLGMMKELGHLASW